MNFSGTKNAALLFILLTTTYLFPSHPAMAFQDGILDSLIKKVQITSQRAYDEIQTATFKGHSKSYVYFAFSPFEIKLIPVMEEYFFDGFWMKPDSLRIIVKAIRTVEADTQKIRYGGNIPLPNPFQFIYDFSALGMQKAMRDSLETNIWPLYPFAIGADSVYHYRKINEIGFGSNKIMTVKVTPIQSHIPAVSGKFMIDVNKHIVVGSDVIFNEAASFTRAAVRKEKRRFTLNVGGSENHKIKTDKALLYGSYWLPENVEEEFEIHIMGIKARVYRLIQFESYAINTGQPDSSTGENKKIAYKIDPELEKEVFANIPYPNRLTKEEQEKIIKKIEDKFSSAKLFTDMIESDEVAKEAVKIGWEQTAGPYFRFAQQLGNYLIFNRVEGLRQNYSINITNFILNNSVISLKGGYGFKDKRFKGEADVLYFLTNEKNIFLEGNLFNDVGHEEDKRLITRGKNTFTSLLYKGDYRDYYYKKGINFGIGIRPTDNLALKFAFVAQSERKADIKTRFSIFKYKEPFRHNPGIAEGKFQGFRTSLFYRIYNFDAEFSAEYTDRNVLHSDFSYTLITTNLNRSYKLTTNSSLNIFVSAGLSTGKLPPQKWFDFGGKTFMNYHGNMRGIDYKAFTGDRMANATIEYSIIGSEFYDLGFEMGLLKALKLHLWGGAGWSSLSEESKQIASDIDTPTQTTDGIYNELGIGLGDRFNILRLDLVWNNVSKNKVLFSLNVLR